MPTCIVERELCLVSPYIIFVHVQNFLRNQNNKNNYNLVCETLQFLDCICGSTTGGLGLLGLYINEKNVGLINQTVESLTEYCQGPCHENQVRHVHAEQDCGSSESYIYLVSIRDAPYWILCRYADILYLIWPITVISIYI